MSENVTGTLKGGSITVTSEMACVICGQPVKHVVVFPEPDRYDMPVCNHHLAFIVNTTRRGETLVAITVYVDRETVRG